MIEYFGSDKTSLV